jgi:mannopine transport system substrate-binding protein
MRITRRTAMAGAATLPFVSTAKAAGGEVIIATTGGLMTNSLQSHFYKRFEAETGIRVRAIAIELVRAPATCRSMSSRRRRPT